MGELWVLLTLLRLALVLYEAFVLEMSKKQEKCECLYIHTGEIELPLYTGRVQQLYELTDSPTGINVGSKKDGLEGKPLGIIVETKAEGASEGDVEGT